MKVDSINRRIREQQGREIRRAFICEGFFVIEYGPEPFLKVIYNGEGREIFTIEEEICNRNSSNVSAIFATIRKLIQKTANQLRRWRKT